MKLREYQEKAIEELRQRLKFNNRLLYVAPTGSGKTATTAFMLGGAKARGNSSTFVVHRRELIRQVTKALSEQNIPHGIIAPGYAPTTHIVQIASVQTLVRRMHKLTRPDLLIVDEAHHCVLNNTWGKVVNGWDDSKVIGLTATPWRLSGEGLADIFEDMVLGPSVPDLIKSGFLCDYKLYAPPLDISMEGARKRMGDYVKSDLDAILDKPAIIGDALEHYKKICPGKRAIVFCASIKHSEHVAKQFQQAGFNAAHIDGKTPSDQRDQAVDDFSKGKIEVLTNVDLVGEGFDVPGIEVVIMLRPTCSLTLYMQQVGRGLRPSPGKDNLIVLDHVNNVLRHGLPDEEREWELTHGKSKAKNATPNLTIIVCKECFRVYRQSPQCPYCGSMRQIKEREIEKKKGELSETDKAEIELRRKQLRQEVGKAKSLDELREIARKRGYSQGWAYHVYHSRQHRKQKRAKQQAQLFR